MFVSPVCPSVSQTLPTVEKCKALDVHGQVQFRRSRRENTGEISSQKICRHYKELLTLTKLPPFGVCWCLLPVCCGSVYNCHWSLLLLLFYYYYSSFTLKRHNAQAVCQPPVICEHTYFPKWWPFEFHILGVSIISFNAEFPIKP